jgi:creatinine amidohydrolase
MSRPHRQAGYLGDLAGPDTPTMMREGRILLQPIGSFEHHGPHLPLATDAIIADSVARAVVTGNPSLDVSVLPTLAYGLSTEHIWAPGTVTLSVPTLLGILDDIAASAVRAGAERLAILNSHGGNTHLLRVACREIRARHGLDTFLLHCELPPDNGGPPGDLREEGWGIHGGLTETSIVLYLREDLVTLSRASRSIPSWVDNYETLGLGGAAEFAWLSNDLSPDGVIGDPTLATAEEGKKRFEISVATVATALAEISTFRFPGSSRV